VVICLEQGADLHMAQLMPLPLTVSCFSKIQIGFTFLVPCHLGSPGQRAIKRVCVCVCVSFVVDFGLLVNACFCCVRYNFFSLSSQEIALGKRVRNDLFFVKWDVNPHLSQSVNQSITLCDVCLSDGSMSCTCLLPCACV